ncbi:hypothetical protein ACHAXT_001340 [Thalassiosira profunda]
MKTQCNNILTAAAAVAILLAKAPAVASVSVVDSDGLAGLVHDPLIGCWDDQFNGTANSNMLITASDLIISYAADYDGSSQPPSTFTILPNYTSTFDTTSDEYLGLSVITSNDPNDQWAAGGFSDFDMVIDFSLVDGGVDLLYYCQIDWNDPTAVEAAKSDAEVDYSDFDEGCNGFPWSKMRRSAEGCGIDLQVGDGDTTVGDDSDADDGGTAAPATEGGASSAQMAAAGKHYVQAVVALFFSVGAVTMQ